MHVSRPVPQPLTRATRILYRAHDGRLRPAWLLLPKEELNRVWVLRKVLTPLSPTEAMELLLSKMGKTKTNADFLAAMASGKL